MFMREQSTEAHDYAGTMQFSPPVHWIELGGTGHGRYGVQVLSLVLPVHSGCGYVCEPRGTRDFHLHLL